MGKVEGRFIGRWERDFCNRGRRRNPQGQGPELRKAPLSDLSTAVNIGVGEF